MNATVRVSDGTRTRDHLDHNQELYLLSYAHRVGGHEAPERNLAVTQGRPARVDNRCNAGPDGIRADRRAGTAITPCVLPVLPALLSASAIGGRRRPVGIALGLAITFTITIVGLASVIDGVGVANGTARSLAIAVLLGFGLMLLWPRLADRVEAPLYRLARFGPRSRGNGFWSGIVVGGALGFLYAPCAGPILAAVVSVSASQGSSLEILAVALAYGAGSAAVLLALALGGRPHRRPHPRGGARPGGAACGRRGDDRHRDLIAAD